MLACRYQPSTVFDQSGNSRDESDGHTSMQRCPTQYHRPSHSVGRCLATAHDYTCRGYSLGYYSNPNLTGHPHAGSPGPCEWAPHARWSQMVPRQFLYQKARTSSTRIYTGIEGPDVSTHTTDDSVSFRVHPALAHSRRLVSDDQSRPTTSEGLALTNSNDELG